MGTSFADLDHEVLLKVAQHLILSSSVANLAQDRIPFSSLSETGNGDNPSSNCAQPYAPKSRTHIRSLINPSSDAIQPPQFKVPSTSQKNATNTQYFRPRPGYILPLLLTCRKIYASLSVEGNPKLYRWLYEQTFDTSAVKRRWNSSFIPSWHFREDDGAESESDSTHREVKRRKSATGRTVNLPSKETTSRMNELDLENNHVLLAEEYRERMKMFRRIKAWSDQHEASSDIVRQDVKVEGAESTQMVQDLWMLWWMVTEHDERNIPVIRELTSLDKGTPFLYQKVYLSDALSAGLPPSTVTKALLAWLAVRLGMVTVFEDTPEQVDEKVFALTPFALASFKYPLYIAPWTFRVLPLIKVAESAEELRLMSQPNAFMPDLTPKELGVPVKRFGREWKVLPNFYADAAGLIFDGVLDRHPHLVTLGKRLGTPSYHATFPHLNLPIPKPNVSRSLRGSEQSSPGEDEKMRHARSFFPPQPKPHSAQQLTSIEYDQDFMRSMSCASPITSPGLPPLFHRRKLEGTWKGAYIFFDFEAYRRVLGGNLRSLYEGAYGHQDCEWNITESVINVKYDRLGGNGGFLSAGFKIDQSAEEAMEEARMTPDERGWEPCEDENAPDRPGWTKEILLTGQARHSWGTSEIYGRVRMWDGLVMMRQDFSHRPVGRWLYTGYIHAGGLMVGRWRDTFTPENLRGYENAFHLQKISDSADLPIRWSESDYRRYDSQSVSSCASSQGLSSSAASAYDIASKPYSPGERASSQASSRSHFSAPSPQVHAEDMPILPPIRNPAVVPGIIIESPARVKPILPPIRHSLDRDKSSP